MAPRRGRPLLRAVRRMPHAPGISTRTRRPGDRIVHDRLPASPARDRVLGHGVRATRRVPPVVSRLAPLPERVRAPGQEQAWQRVAISNQQVHLPRDRVKRETPVTPLRLVIVLRVHEHERDAQDEDQRQRFHNVLIGSGEGRLDRPGVQWRRVRCGARQIVAAARKERDGQTSFLRPRPHGWVSKDSREPSPSGLPLRFVYTGAS